MHFDQKKLHILIELCKPEFLWWWQNYMAENSALAESMAKSGVAPN
jgi:hypothetical protein